jgi:SAM-dependent methyltransferase
MRQLVKKLNMQVTTANASPSALGGSRIEVSPLGLRIFSVLDLTEDVLRRAGIERGMRVLDLECGAGNAALSIAKLIGPSGLVVGVDRSREAIDVAEKRATVAGYCYWTRFVAADPNTFVPHERFDAVVVRPTLFRQGERATFLRLSACVRPDGVIMVSLRASRRKCRFDSSSNWLAIVMTGGSVSCIVLECLFPGIDPVEAGADCWMFDWRQNDAKDHCDGEKEEYCVGRSRQQ